MAEVQSRSAAAPAGHDHRRPARRVAGGRRARGRQHLDLGPLLPALRRPRRRALRGVHAARGDGRRHRATRSIGALVTCNSYRNPNLLADMARTIDHLSDGRFILGIGSGWFERDYNEYGYEFGTAPGAPARPRATRSRCIMDRLGQLDPAAGRAAPDPHRRQRREGHAAARRRVRRRVEHVRSARRTTRTKNAVLDEWCAKLGRDPRQIERTVGDPARPRSTTGRRTSTPAPSTSS